MSYINHDNFRVIERSINYGHKQIIVEKRQGIAWPAQKNTEFIKFLGGHPHCGGIKYETSEDSGRRTIKVWNC